MDYTQIYIKLITRANNRVLAEDVFCEKHHIIPRCLGGTNALDNICKLTLKEHFFAHLILVKMHPESVKLRCALWNMCNVNPKRGKGIRYKPSSRLYNRLREEYMTICRGKNHHLFNRKLSKERVKKAAEGSYKKVYQYSLTGVFIKEWLSAQHIKESLGIPCSNIYSTCLGVKAHLTAKGFRWSYTKQDTLPVLERRRKMRSNLVNKYK